MKIRIWTIVMAAFGAALLWPAARAYAVCTNLADTTSVECKEDAKCVKAILLESAKYATAYQMAVANSIVKSQAGSLTTAPALSCVNGPRVGKPCAFNNGACQSGAKKGGPCAKPTELTDCGSGAVAGACDVMKGCNPSPSAQHPINSY